MSFLPFKDQNMAASTLSSVAVYKKQVTLPAGAAAANYLLFSTESNMGQFTATDVWVHVDDNSGVNTLTFTASVGYNAAAYDNVCSSVGRGSSTLALQYQQYKAVNWPTRLASTYYTNYASPANTATDFYLRSTGPASQMILTIFVVGYYTGMRTYP